LNNISIQVSIRHVVWVVILLSATVVALGIAREIYVALYGLETPLRDLRHIALDTEHCLGSWYSSLLMVAIALLLAATAQRPGEQRWHRHRYVLAAIFMLMSLDESVSFHELLIKPLQPLVAEYSYLHFAWIIPGSLFVILMGLAYLPFVLARPPAIRLGMIAAGTAYVAGALGMEAIGGHFVAEGGFEAEGYIAAFLVEESLEIAGLTLFLITLLHEIAARSVAAAPARALALRQPASRPHLASAG